MTKCRKVICRVLETERMHYVVKAFKHIYPTISFQIAVCLNISQMMSTRKIIY